MSCSSRKSSSAFASRWRTSNEAVSGDHVVAVGGRENDHREEAAGASQRRGLLGLVHDTPATSWRGRWTRLLLLDPRAVRGGARAWGVRRIGGCPRADVRDAAPGGEPRP